MSSADDMKLVFLAFGETLRFRLGWGNAVSV